MLSFVDFIYELFDRTAPGLPPLLLLFLLLLVFYLLFETLLFVLIALGGIFCILPSFMWTLMICLPFILVFA